MKCSFCTIFYHYFDINKFIVSSVLRLTIRVGESISRRPKSLIKKISFYGLFIAGNIKI